MVPSGKTGAGYRIDQWSDVDSPIYTENASLGAGKDLSDTPQTSHIGYCYKEKSADADKKKQSAWLSDEPKDVKKKGNSKMIETTGLALEGTDKGKYYGSVTWGVKIEGTDAAPTVTTIDIAQASKGTPSSNFIEAAKLWNVAKTRGTLKVAASPEATVL